MAGWLGSVVGGVRGEDTLEDLAAGEGPLACGRQRAVVVGGGGAVGILGRRGTALTATAFA